MCVPPSLDRHETHDNGQELWSKVKRVNQGKRKQGIIMSVAAKEKKEKKKTKEVPWSKTEARKLLYKDLTDGTIPLDTNDMAPQVVYLQRPEYSDIEYERFRDRLCDMRKHIQESRDHAASDDAALAHDRAIFPKKSHDIRGVPRWEGSQAEAFLRLDVKQGMNKALKPKDLYMMRSEYQQFPLTVFRKHIEQEVRRVKYIAYRRAKSQQDRA